jgi:hypothetical protein
MWVLRGTAPSSSLTLLVRVQTSEAGGGEEVAMKLALTSDPSSVVNPLLP